MRDILCATHETEELIFFKTKLMAIDIEIIQRLRYGKTDLKCTFFMHMNSCGMPIRNSPSVHQSVPMKQAENG